MGFAKFGDQHDRHDAQHLTRRLRPGDRNYNGGYIMTEYKRCTACGCPTIRLEDDVCSTCGYRDRWLTHPLQAAGVCGVAVLLGALIAVLL